jgi:hypothetical protein
MLGSLFIGDGCSDAETTKADFPSLPTPNHPTSAVYIVKTLEAGGTAKYRVDCDPNTTLADLRVILHNDIDHVMSSDDRFHQGEYRIAMGSEVRTEWKDILEVIRT